MAFISTRGGDSVTASQAILRGLAPNGGLYVPEQFPHLTLDDIAALTDMDYRQRALTILSGYLDDFTAEELSRAIANAYDAAKFDDAAIAPTKRLNDNTHVLELFHGPTLAFKDMALQLLPHLTTLSARKNGENREVAILVATSGDTGKAALEGFKDVPGTSCTVFYPTDGVSDVQKLQMTTTGGDNTHVIAINGNFDDAQSGVKTLFGSDAFHQQVQSRGKVLSSANSINFGRLVPQIVYYFSAYADLLSQGAIALGDAVNFVVPTGNFGNILAGYYAKQMGLPIGKLLCASNRNNVLTDFFQGGTYNTNRPFHKTTSPSMDILISSNLERLLFECADRDGAQIATWMQQLKQDSAYTVGQAHQEWLLRSFAAGCADDNDCADEIAQVFTQYHYLMDTHTAVASRVLRNYRAETGDATPTVIVSTASPYKFAADVLTAAAGADAADGLDAFGCSDRLAQLSSLPVPQQVTALRTLPIRHKARCEKDAMAQAVLAAFDTQA